MTAERLAAALQRRSIHYGWVMVGLTFLTSLSTASVMGLVGVLILPLQTEFGWSATDIGGPLSLRLALFGITAPFAAAFMARYGLRRVVSVALIMIMTGVGLASQVTHLWELWLSWGLLVGLGTGLTAMVLGATVANRWFTARRGLVMGMLTAANATGQLLFLPLAAHLSDVFGWRMAVVPATFACGIAWLLMLTLGREYPCDVGLPAYGESVVTQRPAVSHSGNPFSRTLIVLAEAAVTPVFWMLFFTFFVCGLSTNGLVQNHFIPLCHDLGLEAVAAAGVLAMMGAFDFVGTIGSGWLTDRFDSRWLLFMYYGLRGLSLMALPYMDFTLFGLSLFAVFYGLDWIATVPPTVRIASQEFGREKGPMVFGWAFAAHQLGAAVAATGGAVVRDSVGSYLPAFFAAGVACLLAALAAVIIRRRISPAVA